MTSGVGVQSNVVNMQNRQSVLSKTDNTPSEIVSVKSSSPSASKVGAGQQQADSRSRDAGVKTDVRYIPGLVKVQAPATQKTYPAASVLSYTKTSSPTAPQFSKQGTSDDWHSLLAHVKIAVRALATIIIIICGVYNAPITEIQTMGALQHS